MYCWQECKMVWSLWKTVWRLLKKLIVKSRITMCSCNSTSGCILTTIESRVLEKYLHTHFYSITIGNCQEVETTQMSINKLWYVHGGIGLKKAESPVTHYIRHEWSLRTLCKVNKPVTKGQMLCDPTYIENLR